MRILSNLPNTTAGTTERPDGAVKDVSAPAAGDGTPFRADWNNDSYYALLAVMDTVGIAADDSDEEFEAGTGSSQFLDAMRLFVQEWAYPGLDFGLQNISAGNQTSDITIYESGGGSEKEDGFTVRLHWTGGDGTFNHAITSAYTIGNELAGFIAANLWIGHGAGELVLRLDKTNSKWLVLTPGFWDYGTFTAGDWRKSIDKKMWAEQNDRPPSNNSTTWTFPVAFKAATVPFVVGSPDGITEIPQGNLTYIAGTPRSNTSVTWGSWDAGVAAFRQHDCTMRAEGFWA